ncbi:MAG: DHH family phosphoesterase [Erysipelotrichaceae bacterium]
MSLLEKKILEYHEINIFYHQSPDMDAFGSAYGLEEVIKANYPDKIVRVVSDETADISTDSLAIIVDCSVAKRIFNQNYLKAKYSISIDHHPKKITFADTDITKVAAAATCELLVDLVSEFASLNPISAKWFYQGLLTDTLNFTTSNTTCNTLKVGSQLLEFGLDVVAIQDQLFGVNMAEFRFAAYLKTVAEYYDGYIVVRVSEQMCQENNVTMEYAKGCVRLFTNVNGIKVVVMAYQNIETGNYNVSLRSKQIVINTLANKYGGGGHAMASGIKDLSLNEIISLLSDVENLIKKNKGANYE